MKKNKKGFTLVEVIIAISVFAIMALLVCTLYAFLSRMIYMSNAVNTNVDSQVADYEQGDDVHITDDTKTISFLGVYHSANNVHIDYTTINDSGAGSGSNPDIKYFSKP